MKRLAVGPSEALSHIDIGEEFQRVEDSKYYILLSRNILWCVVAKETWWDKVVTFFRGESEYVRTQRAFTNRCDGKKEDSVV